MSNLMDRMGVHVADLQVLYVKLHNYHWHVKGPQFRSIHEYTEALYDEVTGFYDDVAERMLMLGAKPPVTMKEYLTLTNIKEEPLQEFTVAQVLEGVKSDLTYLLGELKQTRVLAADQNDAGTDGLLTDIISSLEKHLWMIGASLKA